MDELIDLQKILGYHFKNQEFLLQAVTHTTFAYESKQKDVTDNQRLEFLGDSILEMTVAEHLYKKYPSFDEGELTRRRALLVNKHSLCQKAKQLSLFSYLLIGKGEEKSGGRYNPKNLASTLEAIIGAIYLDRGYESAKKFILEKVI